MTGLVEIKNQEGNVFYTCLFGMQVFIRYGKLNNLTYTEVMQKIQGNGDVFSQIEALQSLAYLAAKNYANYTDSVFDESEDKFSTKWDVERLWNNDNINRITKALNEGFEGMIEDNTKKKKLN